MDKRVEANLKVKKKIGDALFSLLEEKKIHDITISEIVKKAKVARVSYYRNFDSKESIIYDIGYRMHDEYRKNTNFDLENITYSSILYSFKFYLKNKNYISRIFKIGYSYIFLQLLNEFVEEASGDMPAKSMDKYKIYFYTGAIFNIVIKWVENDMKETPEDMAKTIIKFLK